MPRSLNSPWPRRARMIVLANGLTGKTLRGQMFEERPETDDEARPVTRAQSGSLDSPASVAVPEPWPPPTVEAWFLRRFHQLRSEAPVVAEQVRELQDALSVATIAPRDQAAPTRASRRSKSAGTACVPALTGSSISAARTWQICPAARAGCWCATTR